MLLWAQPPPAVRNLMIMDRRRRGPQSEPVLLAMGWRCPRLRNLWFTRLCLA